MSNIVEGVGTSSGRRTGLGAQIELAMANVIHEIAAESKAIWEDETIDLEDRRARVAALNTPEAVLARKLEVRDALKAQSRAEVAAAAESEE